MRRTMAGLLAEARTSIPTRVLAMTAHIPSAVIAAIAVTISR
jgi:hypothetical protein